MPSTWPKDVTQYKICKQIGKGGSADVFKAQTTDGRWVALKRINLMKMGKHKELIKKEYKMQKELNHRNILKMHTKFKDATGNFLYFVLELAETDLDKHLRSERPTEVQARRWFRQIVDAMEYLHSKNVYHRDMKLANVLLDSNGVIKIADFGLCVRLEDSDDLRNTFCGTPQFMAPEVAEKNNHGLKSEVWSLGVILLRMLTNTNPFNSTKKEITLKKISAMDEQQLSQHYDHLNKDARDLLSALLQIERDKRPSITEVRSFPWLYIKPLVTRYIQPIRKHTKKGSGIVEVLPDQRVVYTVGAFRMEVSKDGQIVNILEEGEQSEQNLLDLPPIHNRTYKFLRDFCEGIRSRTRIIELNDYINDVSLIIMANKSVKVVRKEKTILTFRRGEFVTAFAKYRPIESLKDDRLPPFPLELGKRPGFRVVHAMWDAVKNEVVAPEEAPLSLEWDNSSGTTFNAVASSPPGGISCSHANVSTPSTPFPTSNSIQLKPPSDETLGRQVTVSQSYLPEVTPVNSVCTAVISTCVAATEGTTSNQSCKTSLGNSEKRIAKSHQELSQQKEPSYTTWSISTQIPVAVFPVEPRETAISYLTTNQAFLPIQQKAPNVKQKKAPSYTTWSLATQIPVTVYPVGSRETAISYPTTSQAFLPIEEKEPGVQHKVQDENGQPGPFTFSSGRAIRGFSPEGSNNTAQLENCFPSPSLQVTTTLPEENMGIERLTILESKSRRYAQRKVDGRSKDLTELEPKKDVILEEIRSSPMLARSLTEPVSFAPILEPRQHSSTPLSTVQPSNPPTSNTYEEESLQRTEDEPGGGNIFRRAFIHNGSEVTFWPSTGIFREIHHRSKTKKWMIPKPYAVWIEDSEGITVQTEKGRFSWDPRQIVDPDNDFPYWNELKHILEIISRMVFD